MGGVMKNPLQDLIDRAYLLCLKLDANEIMNDLVLMNGMDLQVVIVGLQRMVDAGGGL